MFRFFSGMILIWRSGGDAAAVAGARRNPGGFLCYPLSAEPSAEDLGWIFAALIAIVFAAAVLVMSWLISR